MLRRCLPESISQTLDQLPESLDDTYLHVLSQIPQANQKHAHRILQCLALAVRPLRVSDLAVLLAFDFDTTPGGIPKYRAVLRLDDQTQAVLSTCSSLVTVIDDNQYGQIVLLSHFSVKEFLISNRLKFSLGVLSQYHICLGSAHTLLTRACLGILLHFDDHINKESVTGFPLAEYAARHWFEHAQFEDVASRVKEGMTTLFDSDQPYFAGWVGLYDIDSPKFYEWDLSAEISPDLNPNPLYYAVLCGFYDMVEYLAIKNPQHVHALSGQYSFPLLAALGEGHVKVAELLLQHGADVDAREKTGTTVLLKALSRPQRNLAGIVKFLLEHGADVNAQDNNLRNSIHFLAEHGGNLEVARMLIWHGADINSRDDSGKTPLHALSERRISKEDDVLDHARLLLRHGAGANIQDKCNQTPLHLAIRHNRFMLAQLFLEHGAEPNAEDNSGKTPLHVLSECQVNGQTDGDVLNYEVSERGAKNRRHKDNETEIGTVKYKFNGNLSRLTQMLP